MKKIFALSIVALLTQICLGQRPDSISVADVEPHVYTFQVEDGKLFGPGAELLIEEIKEAQFFLLGEYHYDSGISNLTKALLPELADAGFDHFAVEVGPYSAEKLTQLSKSKDLQGALHGFYTDNYALTNHQPIPFFAGMEDAAFLETAVDEGFDLWGLDQEYLGGFLFLFEDLWVAAGQPGNLQTEYEAARERLKQYYQNNLQDEDNEVYDQILNDERFFDILQKLSKNCCDGQQRADEILESCQIYHDWRADLLENLEGRAALMKEHFSDYYRSTHERQPKVFIKMGGMHTARGFTGNLCYELGNMVHELANFNGTKDLSVSFSTRYYLDDETGEIGDNLTYKSQWVRNMTPILAQGRTDEWVIIDLRPIKRMWVNRERTLNPQIRALIQNNDYIIIMPPLPEVTLNYEQG